MSVYEIDHFEDMPFDDGHLQDRVSLCEDRIRFADELPFLRPSLRREFVAGITVIDRRRERMRRGLMAAALLLSVSGLWAIGQLWPDNAVAQQGSFGTTSRVAELEHNEAVLKVLPPGVATAVRHSDGFKLVDALSTLRQEHSKHLGRVAD